MYNVHPLLQSPDNENAKIWRYIDLTKFLDMLEKRSLYFTRADTFTDKFEGIHPKPKLQNNSNSSEKNLLKDRENFITNMAHSLLRLNCWNILDYESEPLWKAYVKHSGIVIQSTFRKLKESFADTSEEVHIGKVKYIDYAVETFPNDNVFYLVFHKRKFYELENELRACIMLGTPGTRYVNFNNLPIGLHIPVNLDILIEKIILWPDCPVWFKEVIESLVEKYGMNTKIQFSELSEKPSV